MAIGRLSVKVGKVGKAQPHAAYIARQGQYASRLERGEQLEHTAAGNMPAWAQHDPLVFWQAADTFERKNGSTYREYEIALPRELSPDQRRELVDDFIKQELGDKHAYQYAIHNPKAADGDEQPHCHLMFCERINDGIERDPDQYFKRYNSKHPERGGAEKANKSKDFATRQHELKQLRQRWEKTCNQHLERAGSAAYIDMRSYQERGIDRVPEPKKLPSEWRKPEQQAELIELRQTRQANDKAQAELKQAMPDLKAEVVNFELAERQRRGQGVRMAAFDKKQAHKDYYGEWRKEVNQIVKAYGEEAKELDKSIGDSQARLAQHDKAKPKKGLFERQKTHVAKLDDWQETRDHLEKRLREQEKERQRVGSYTSAGYAQHPSSQSDLSKLAHERVKINQPFVAANYEKAQALEAERKAARLERKKARDEREREKEREERRLKRERGRGGLGR